MRQQHAAPAVGCLIPNYLDEYLQQALSAIAYKKSPDADVSCADRIEEFEFESELDQLIEERRAQDSDHLQTTASASTTIGFT
jgi:hypothetical protein